MTRQRVNDVELNWNQYGEATGTPLVLLHGYTGSSYDFSLQVESLSKARSVITLDHRGHGSSTKTGRLTDFTIDKLVADLIAFLDQVVDVPVDLLGHSLGGRVALGATLARPDLIRSLILEDTSAWSFFSEDESVRTLIADFMKDYEPANGIPSRLGLDTPEDALEKLATTSQWRQRKDELFASVDPFAMKALGTELLVEGIKSVRDQLPTITQPATVIAGSNDHPLIDQAPDLAAELGHGHLVVIDGAYHSPHLTHSVQWRDAVDRHLEHIS